MKKNLIVSRESVTVRRCAHLWRVTVALLSLCLMMLSAGCSKKQIVYVPAQCPRLPAELLQATAVPEPRMTGPRLSWGESLEWNDALLDALDSANKDKAALLKADGIRAGASYVKG